MLASTLKTIRDNVIWVLPLGVAVWAIFLTLLDLSIFVLTGEADAGAPGEETLSVPGPQSECVEIDGIQVCN